jgi:hypothetical protein
LYPAEFVTLGDDKVDVCCGEGTELGSYQLLVPAFGAVVAVEI